MLCVYPYPSLILINYKNPLESLILILYFYPIIEIIFPIVYIIANLFGLPTKTPNIEANDII